MKKKVLIFTLGAIGGAERMALTIGKLLPRDTFNVKFVILGDDKRILDFMPNGYEVDIMPFSTRSFFSIIHLWQKIKKEQPDIVFGTQTRINSQTIIASKFAKKKVVIRNTSMVSNYGKLTTVIMRLIYPYADRIIAQQEEMRHQMAEVCRLDINKIIALKNVLDFSNIDKLKDAPSPFANNGNVNYVFVARIHPCKCHDIAIRALSIVRQDIPNAHLYCVGTCLTDDNYYHSLLQLVEELNLKDCVHFVGYDNNPYRWVKNCSCFVSSSHHEGLPNALIEASYLGVPCVAVKCLDIIKDIIKDGYNGYAIEQYDVKGFAHGMINAVKLNDFKMLYHSSSVEDFVNLFLCL